ncbi:MAG: DUF362 domain-containing protein [Thermodesulfobacteriota bacterium]
MEIKHKVLIRRCDEYDPGKIAGIIREGMEELGISPRGNVLLKPNAVIAHPEIFPHAFTRKEFLEGVILAVKQSSGDIKELTAGERSGITVPTRFCFRNAGYLDLLRKYHVRPCYFEEVPQVPVPLKGRKTLRTHLHIPKPVSECDFFINLPKFKAHPWCRITLSLKNLIGIQDDRYRLIDHNSFLDQKIADLQSVIQPGFIAIDGITAGQRMMLTPTPFKLGAIIMGTNPCAVDTVGCHMVNLDPKAVKHLAFSSERGFGPVEISEIEVGGDFPLSEVKRKTREFQFCMERIDEYFRKSGNLTCTVGSFPEAHSRDYCWGGCPGALQEAMHILRGFYPQVDQTMKRIRYVVGKVEAPLDIEKDERVIFAGNCTEWEGSVDGLPVSIESSYRGFHEVDQDHPPSNDMLLKTFKAFQTCVKSRKLPYLHARGCPVSVADHVNYLAFLGAVPNPNLDPRLIFQLTTAYWRMRFGQYWGSRNR